MPSRSSTSSAPLNPYAICIRCDASMAYDSKSTGTIGVNITFPESVPLDPISFSGGTYQGGNIERLELQAIQEGMSTVLELYDTQAAKLLGVGHIIILTDRLGLSDGEKTNPNKIRDWRRNKWHNFEGKAIKNADFLERIDKLRTKLIRLGHCKVEIQHARRRTNRIADKLSRDARKQPPQTAGVALTGMKVGRRKLEGSEVDYRTLHQGDQYVVHVYMKQPVQDQWAISTEICRGQLRGRKLKIYCGSSLERRMHRHHLYMVTVQRVFNHHVVLSETFDEVDAAT